MIKKIFIGLALTGMLMSACNNDKEDQLNAGGDTCTGINAAFAANVSPIIQTNCAVSGCHNSGSTNGPGALTSYTQIKNAASAIKATVQAGTMPKGGSLSAGDKKIITCWVDAGAPNN